MFKILLIGITSILFVGVIRRWFFAGAWRFVVPLIAGVIVGPPIAAIVTKQYVYLPEYVMIGAPIFMSIAIAGILKRSLDEILGPQKR